jgi:tetratricopeptide (TPR) repeat protein
MFHLNKSTPEDFQRGLAYLHEAVENDPADALAYSGLALGYVTLGHGPAPPPDAWMRAREAAERAVRLDSTLAEAWAALADVKTYFEWDWDGAEDAFQRANALNPNLAMNHYHYAWYLILFGRVEEALAEHRRAQELDPLTPLHTVWLPGVYLYTGHYARALDEARRTAEQYPENATALYVLGTSAAQMGEFDEAIAAHEKMVEVNPRWKSALGRTYAVAGRTEDARRILAELEAQPPTSWGAIGLADLHTALGNKDEAFRWLAYEPAHGWLPWSRANPALEPLRDDPRFHDLMRHLGLPE